MVKKRSGPVPVWDVGSGERLTEKRPGPGPVGRSFGMERRPGLLWDLGNGEGVEEKRS